MDIACITSNVSLIDSLASHYEREGIRFFDYFGATQSKSVEIEDDIYLIFSPIFHNRSYIYYDILWKRYLNKQNPNAVLLTAGFAKGPQNNYLDLLDLPAKLQSCISQTKAVKEKWVPFYNGGIRMEERLHLFFKGHGKQSVLDVLHRIKRKIHLVERELQHGDWSYHKATSEYLGSGYVSERWQDFKTRWINYYEYFAYSPFREEFLEIDGMISAMDAFFLDGYTDENLFYKLRIWEQIQVLQSKLTEIRDQYGGKKEL